MSSDRSYGQFVETTINLDNQVDTRSYGQFIETTIDLTTPVVSRSYGQFIENVQIDNMAVPKPYYRCNTGSGTTLNDDSQSGALDGTLSNAAIWNGTGGPLGGTCLDAAGAYTGSVDTGSSTISGINSSTNSFSVSIWVWRGEAGGTILSKRSSSSDAQLVLKVAADGTLTFEYEKSGNNYSLSSSAGAIPDATWKHVAVSVSTASPPVIKLYVNASEVASGTATATVSASTANLNIAGIPGFSVLPSYYWKFNTGSGSTAVAAIGGQDGTIVGSPTWATGIQGTALDYDADSKYTTLPTTSTTYFSSDTFTISVWFNRNASQNYRYLLDHNSNKIAIDLFTGSIRFNIGGSYFSKTASISTLGVWYHLVITSDPTDVIMYLNAANIGSKGSAGIAPTMTGGVGTPLYLGKHGTGYGVKSIVDEFAIWDGTALNASQVTTLYNSGASLDLSSAPEYFDGRLDEIAFWPNYTLTPDNVTRLYNSGTPQDLTNGIPDPPILPGNAAWFF